MVRLLLTLLLSLPALAVPVTGRVTDGARGLEGVRVHPDRGVRVRPRVQPPVAYTDAQGAFSLDLDPAETHVVVEKSGFQRDLVPVGELAAPVVLGRAPGFRKERVLVVRLDFPDQAPLRTDAELRALFFGRGAGEASAANYFYEISKGSLELEEGAFLHLADAVHPAPRTDAQRGTLVAWVLERIKSMDLKAYDQVDNRTGALRPDGKPDHLWVVPPGPPGTVTRSVKELTAICLLEPLPWNRYVQWPAVFFTDETPLGFIVHEALHAMGENRVDDFYLDSRHPLTAGAWDVMDAGMFRGWDRFHPEAGPWQEDTAYSPSQPMGWVRDRLWYHGAFKDTVSTLQVRRAWEGWLDPLERAPRDLPQRLVIPDPRRRGRFWELNVRRPLGFDRGRVGDRWGPGYEGLVVARVDPGLLTRGEPRGPVRIVDAHPRTPGPPAPSYPGGRWQLDDAAFNVGPGEAPAGRDGPLSWEVLEADASGRLRVRVRVR
ncbi:carboxypeptidase-like regulatory domain-containing protein [Geothrix sp. 21YS21S-2]|uniref:carboxypeptidase-like regulatory domain-containing protein n=1 Tax=Geothrix sp. 21YS21S-2 TaxID=3068893 RepID=UPI0027B975BF|nr:carboxypeptidase-like regulatory domain-containing protein [Geothrix sp. 21YS21S-2]